MNYDVIVIGVGGMGSAACLSLAQRGAKVLGLEQYTLGHDRGASHGNTRLIRQAYFEEPRYVPLLKRAYTLWDKVSEESGQENLFHRSGLLIMGSEKKSRTLPGVREAAHLHSIPIEFLTSKEIAQRYPQFHTDPAAIGIFEPGAGYLEVENCVITQASLAEKKGATLRFGEKVLKWEASTSSVSVSTGSGIYRAQKLVIAGGAWSSQLLADLGLPLKIWRAPQFWFSPAKKETVFPAMPCFAFDSPGAFIYGFPSIPGFGIKIADYHPVEQLVEDPDKIDRTIYPQDLVRIQNSIRESFPDLSPEPVRSSLCMYTMTPDENFILDRHPRYPNVSFAAGFSGHGFKFSPVIGEILADLSDRGQPQLPIDFLRLRW